MKTFKFVVASSLLCLGLVHAQTTDPNAPEEFPTNFPSVTAHIYDSNAIGPGYVYLAVAANVKGIGYYLMILENDGTPIWYRELLEDFSYDFKMQPNGLLSYAQFLSHHTYTGGGDAVHEVLDPDFQSIERIQMGNQYTAEAHDFQLLPNGHALLFGYYLTQMDLSEVVKGGYPNALVSGGVVQELDANRNVVFQWRTWDHYSPEEYAWNRQSNGPIVSAFHLNTINMDTDGHIFIATPRWVKKINRQTGEIMWHLGGDENEFTYVGVNAEEASGHFGGHGFYRLDNGNVLIYDGANQRGTQSSQVHEYKLDEDRRIAERVWTYTPDPPVYGWHRGNAQRLPNGNTFIGWGGDGPQNHGPACTEVTPDGKKVFELFFDHPTVSSYRAFRLPHPADITGISVAKAYIGIGDHEFKNTEMDTGVTIRINGYTGTGYNLVGVQRVPLAPVYPTFSGRTPRVLPDRILVDAFGIMEMSGRIAIDAANLGLEDPNLLTVYHRDPQGPGPFQPLPTSYNPATKQLRADMTAFGEFIIGSPDLEHVALAPILVAPELDGTVNQTLPVAMDWTPRGFVNSYGLQVATDPEFNLLVVDEPEIKETPYIIDEVRAETTYYWRARTNNAAGTSEWSYASFTTIPPRIQVTVPNGGERWRRGIEYFIQWQDNLEEDVVLELYQGETLVTSVDTVPSTGAYRWEVDLALDAGSNYSILVRSAVDDSIAARSAAAFAIE